MSESISGSTPWHIWVVGVVGILWNAGGALDYVMTQMRNVEYMSSFTPEELAFFYAIPAWAVATWAIAVWGGVVGCILLLLRRQIAVWVFLASLVAFCITAFQNYVLSNGMEIMGSPFILLFNGIIFLVTVLLYLYARAMRDRGLLA